MMIMMMVGDGGGNGATLLDTLDKPIGWIHHNDFDINTLNAAHEAIYSNGLHMQCACAL